MLHYPISSKACFFVFAKREVHCDSHGLCGTVVELWPLHELLYLLFSLFDLDGRIGRGYLTHQADPWCLEHLSR